LETTPDATLAELVEWAGEELGITLSIKAMWKRLKVLNLSLKKRR
jgi:transposase